MKIKVSKEDLRKWGLIFCECGHPRNNHFTHDKKPCAHCGCKKLKETLLRKGFKFIK